MTKTPPHDVAAAPAPFSLRPWLPVILLVLALTAMRIVYAGAIELRTDEAYYWTWTKESVLSFSIIRLASPG